MKRQIKKRILEPEKRIILDIPHEIKDFNMSSTPKNNLFAQLKPNSDKNVEKKVLKTSSNFKNFSFLKRNSTNITKLIFKEGDKSLKKSEKVKYDEKNKESISIPSIFSKNDSKKIYEKPEIIKLISNSNSVLDNQIKKNYNSENISNPSSIAIQLNSLLSSNNNIEITLNNLNTDYPNFVKSTFSVKHNNYIRAYSSNTNKGIIRYFNFNPEITMKIEFL